MQNNVRLCTRHNFIVCRERRARSGNTRFVLFNDTDQIKSAGRCRHRWRDVRSRRSACIRDCRICRAIGNVVDSYEPAFIRLGVIIGVECSIHIGGEEKHRLRHRTSVRVNDHFRRIGCHFDEAAELHKRTGHGDAVPHLIVIVPRRRVHINTGCLVLHIDIGLCRCHVGGDNAGDRYHCTYGVRRPGHTLTVVYMQFGNVYHFCHRDNHGRCYLGWHAALDRRLDDECTIGKIGRSSQRRDPDNRRISLRHGGSANEDSVGHNGDSAACQACA